jgi:hypothetical protein
MIKEYLIYYTSIISVTSSSNFFSTSFQIRKPVGADIVIATPKTIIKSLIKMYLLESSCKKKYESDIKTIQITA